MCSPGLMGRRDFGAAIAAALVVASSELARAETSATMRGEYEVLTYPFCQSFADVHKWLSSIRVKQVDGNPDSVCKKTGKPYITIHLGALSRGGDEAEHEKLLADAFCREVVRHVENACKTGTGKLSDLTIFWRARPEFEIRDRDEWTKSGFVVIPGWKQLGAYARISVGASV